MSYAREQLYSVADLKDRGWTDTAIETFLPKKSDDTRDNPHYARAGAPMKLWLKTRVHRVEKTKRFLAWQEGVQSRKHAAAKAVATRIENMVEAMENVEITIARGWTDEQIRELAARTHGGNYRGNPGRFVWSNRTARNCIRHCLTNYEALLEICNRRETGRPAYNVLRGRVDALIDEAYPQFADFDDFEDMPVGGMP